MVCVVTYYVQYFTVSGIVTAFGWLPYSTRFKTLSLYIMCSFDNRISVVTAPISTYLKFIVAMAISSGGL